MRSALLTTLLPGLLLAAPAAGGELQDDLKARRARLMERLGPEAVFIAWSAPTRNYSRSVDYEYRQDSNLLYLTGITQPETVLVLMPGNQKRKEILFTQPADPRREHREGHILRPEEATAESGIETVYSRAQLEPFLDAVLNRQGYPVGRRGVVDPEYDAFFTALKDGRARMALILGPRPGLTGPLPPVFEFANKVRERFLGLSVVDATESVEGLRQVKTPYEQKVLERSVAISSQAHRAGMKAAAPGRHEFEVEAAIEQAYLASGAMSWGYPSIVGSGPNATILHYNESSRKMQPGDLLLVDAAANYQGLTGDITRTYPVGGTFSPLQRDLYGLVLEAQEAGMKAAVAGNKTADIEKAAADVVRAGLLKRGLITDASGEQFRTWYTHGIVHWIGMDVHDVGDYHRPLAPGMAFVIEPGLYIREQALDALPSTPENKAFIEKVRPAVARYKDIGVRVEDSFLMTAQGLKRLSDVPRTIEEVEAFLKR